MEKFISFIKENPWASLLALVFTIFALYLGVFGQLRGDTAIKARVIKRDFNSEIIHIGKDWKNHAQPIYMIRDSSMHSQLNSMWRLGIDIFKTIKVGDSVSKNKGEYETRFYREGKLLLELKADSIIDAYYSDKWVGKVKRWEESFK